MIAYFDRFTIAMTLAQAESASQPGKDASDDVAYLLTNRRIARQLDKIGPDLIRAELKVYGAWDESDLADDGLNRERIVWIAACDIAEHQRSKR